jgi:hypothetical protein
MAVELGQIRKGMHVHASDGTDLGEVKAMWPGIDPTSTSVRCDEEVCSRIEVHKGKGRKARTLYIPYNAVAGISNGVVTLGMTVEAATAKGWARRPGWVPPRMGLWARYVSDRADYGGTDGGGMYGGGGGGGGDGF